MGQAGEINSNTNPYLTARYVKKQAVLFYFVHGFDVTVLGSNDTSYGYYLFQVMFRSPQLHGVCLSSVHSPFNPL